MGNSQECFVIKLQNRRGNYFLFVLLCRMMPIKVLSRAIWQISVFWETTTRKGRSPKGSPTSGEEMVALRLLSPGCQGSAPSPVHESGFAPASPEWCLLVPGVCPKPSWDCAPGSHCQLQQDSPPHHARFWADSCLFQCLRWSWMWQKLIFQPGENKKILFLL